MKKLISLMLLVLLHHVVVGQTAMINVYGRNTTLLNGKWETIVDPFDVGSGWRSVYKDTQPVGKTDFLEYEFLPSNTLNVPGDFNSQLPQLLYYESTVWYKKAFDCVAKPDQRLFIHFGAANYIADVYLNGKKLGRHEGGYTPFQFEITGLVKEKNNSLVVRINNARVKNGIPCDQFDWFNYGGITRDVHLIKTHRVYIDDYKIQLDPEHKNMIAGYVQLDTALAGQQVSVVIPELKINKKLTTDAKGFAAIGIKSYPELWTPELPKRYKVELSTAGDSISDRIGFRTIKVVGTEILLNGKPVFLRGVNIHEEIPQRGARATSEEDARMLAGWAKELGCNMVRLVHYPHSEYMIQQAEAQGLLVWEEVPLWQGIAFADPTIIGKAELMLKEVIKRDKNRCSVILWSIANETSPSIYRDQTLIALAKEVKILDPTRLVTAAFNDVDYHDGKAELKDTVMRYVDVIGVNEYMGWYSKWPGEPGKMEWISQWNKPLVMSEFGGEAVIKPIDTAVKASAWSEKYVADIYENQIRMFKTIPFLRGTCPWVLADFRSPGRMQGIYQKGWNRKGLLNEQGEKKKPWFIMKDWYAQISGSGGLK